MQAGPSFVSFGVGISREVGKKTPQQNLPARAEYV